MNAAHPITITRSVVKVADYALLEKRVIAERPLPEAPVHPAKTGGYLVQMTLPRRYKGGWRWCTFTSSRKHADWTPACYVADRHGTVYRDGVGEFGEMHATHTRVPTTTSVAKMTEALVQVHASVVLRAVAA